MTRSVATAWRAFAPYITSGQLTALAITGAERSAALPGVATLRELGVDLGGIDAGTWWGIVAPARTLKTSSPRSTRR